ncbi:SidA/IucD/PvdA family monooxygenase [Pseudomonas sp. B21-012]|uniref:lysine N(6)-hydroxylase/L-ornithine N(5)-oxygenase family protein n=1 Tax=Pseudomonas sp. B21-012 TaxID=2895472 RepID=UPI0021602A16|nr:SidA/IucD/PvdA family monooxygenase [Pseudomonas sp. B21-012]UVM58442.1 SidA/IucD/PvdA family monooxygenase [Pseudomonas sp. B21-012]
MNTYEIPSVGAKGVSRHGERFDVIGLGIGPANLSLAALLEPCKGFKSMFFERRADFRWHEGMMHVNSSLTTSFLKDLVTPADPCSPYSFIAFLKNTERFYSFLNARFPTVRRKEFEQYMVWVCRSLHNLTFDSEVLRVSRDGNEWVINHAKGTARTANLVVGAGQRPFIPKCAQACLGPAVMHSSQFVVKAPQVSGKRVVVIGGGQSGAELMQMMLNLPEASAPASLVWVSRRSNFLPMDDSPFVNEWFVPGYSDHFFGLPAEQRQGALAQQHMASDGVVQALLESIYRRLYEVTYIEGRNQFCRLLPGSTLESLRAVDDGLALRIGNATGTRNLGADLVLLATGSEFQMPAALQPLRFEMATKNGLPELSADYSVKWSRADHPRLFFQNAARHLRGIADPNLSLAAWRSAKIANAVLGKPHYDVGTPPGLVEWGAEAAPPTFLMQDQQLTE